MTKIAIPQGLMDNIDITVERLLSRKFTDDPLFPGQLSKIASVVGSAYKRHGFILEQALLHRLAQNDNFDVWEEKAFSVSSSAEQLVGTFFDHEDHAVLSNLPYLSDPKDSIRTIQIDLMVYNKANKNLISYEVKRGNGTHDAGKKRNMRRDLMIQQTLLKSYGEQKGYDVATVDSKMIFYYGQCSLPKPHSLTGDELDDHFGFKVLEFVEAANKIFSDKIKQSFSELVDFEDSAQGGVSQTFDNITPIIEEFDKNKELKGKYGLRFWSNLFRS